MASFNSAVARNPAGFKRGYRDGLAASACDRPKSRQAAYRYGWRCAKVAFNRGVEYLRAVQNHPPVFA